MKTRVKSNNWNVHNILFSIFLVFIVLLILQLAYISLSPSIYWINMNEFALARTATTQRLYAKRGTIYDMAGELLAINVSSYPFFAYLDES